MVTAASRHRGLSRLSSASATAPPSRQVRFGVPGRPTLGVRVHPSRGSALHVYAQSEPRRREGAAGRQLLEAVPGLRYVPIEPEAVRADLQSAVQAELGQEIWDRLIRDEIGRAVAGGAEIRATIYHGCQRLICGFEAAGVIRIEHYLFVFARGLGIDFEDRCKKD